MKLWPSSGKHKMTVTSTAFADGEEIPRKYTSDGANVNPPVTISEIPLKALTLVIIFKDLDSAFNHWILYNVPASVMQILEDSRPQGMVGVNDFGSASYDGPCPDSGTHKYEIRVWALDEGLDLKEGASEEEIEDIMKGHIIEEASLLGRYTKPHEVKRLIRA